MPKALARLASASQSHMAKHDHASGPGGIPAGGASGWVGHRKHSFSRATRSIGPKQASLAALNPAPWAFAMEPGAAWGPGLKRYVFNLALNEFTKSASLMSSGSEFHKSQFILWGRVIDFFLSSASPSSPLPAANPLPPGLNCLI